MMHIVMFSGGVGSWAAARRVVDEHGPADVTLLFTDTLIEDEDLYRFIADAAADLGVELVRLADGRTPWEVFEDVRFLGNTRAAPCSHLLKQVPARKYVEQYDPDDVTIYVGIDWTEEHRLAGTRRGWDPYRVEAPLCDPPLIDKPDILAMLRARHIEPPRLYGMGFPHNNCGGFCVRAGQAQFRRLLDVFPDRYAAHEEAEESLRQHLGKDVAILRDRRGGVTSPLTMRDFRTRLVVEGQVDPDDWGGCGCFLSDEDYPSRTAHLWAWDREGEG